MCAWGTRGIQKVRRPTQLKLRDTQIVFCHFLTYYPATKMHLVQYFSKLWFRCRRIVVLGLPASHLPCNTNTNGKYTVGDGVVHSRHFGWQPMLELTCDQVRCPGSKWLLFFSKLKEFMKGHKVSDDENVICTANVWLKNKNFLQRNENFGETLDPVHISCSKICRKVTKYEVRIS